MWYVSFLKCSATLVLFSFSASCGMVLNSNSGKPAKGLEEAYSYQASHFVISQGDFHTCALTPLGGVKCWGDNYRGKLGDNTFTYRESPVDVVGLESGVKAVSAGGNHTCALTDTGGVKCWGDNSRGQLGNGFTGEFEFQPAPVDVVGLSSGVESISLGYLMSCALLTSGTVKCWGFGLDGSLGHGQYANSNVPVDVVGISGAKALTLGNEFGCAITETSTVKCWGWNAYGQLGNGTTDNDGSNVPVDVINLNDPIESIEAGNSHACAVTTGGAAYCWGENGYGQIGNGESDGFIPASATLVNGLSSGVRVVSAGYIHSCALMTSGQVKCWGSNNRGQLGTGDRTNSFEPINTLNLDDLNIVSIAAGREISNALTSDGKIMRWGYVDDIGDYTDLALEVLNFP
jgi:alpha-tubulin suppressor-like RCC1 family protein